MVRTSKETWSERCQKMNDSSENETVIFEEKAERSQEQLNNKEVAEFQFLKAVINPTIHELKIIIVFDCSIASSLFTQSNSR